MKHERKHGDVSNKIHRFIQQQCSFYQKQQQFRPNLLCIIFLILFLEILGA